MSFLSAKPMAMLSLQQLQDFHIDRSTYGRFLNLRFDPLPSMKIIAFWNTLEKFGFRNFVYSLQQVSDSSPLSLAKEAIFCLRCLYSPSHQIFPWLHLDFPYMSKLVPKEILLGFLVKNREILKRMIQGFVKDVCQVVFLDILQQNLGSKQSFEKLNGSAGDKPDSPTAKEENNGEVSMFKTDSEGKTLFMTFSRGHPVSDQEIHGFMVGKLCASVESIYMDRNPKCLIDCVTRRSYSDLSRILGGKEWVKLFINGKQVRVRSSNSMWM